MPAPIPQKLEYRLDVMDLLHDYGFTDENLVKDGYFTEAELQDIRDYKPLTMTTLSTICSLAGRDIDDVIGMPTKGKHIMANWVIEEMEHFPNANPRVLQFIQNAITHIPGKEHTMLEFFTCGYCYYFALMLQHTFGGTLCIPGCRGHVVWLDGTNPEKDVAYDAYGVYDNYDPEDINECLIPVQFFGPMIFDLLHLGTDADCFYSTKLDFSVVKNWYATYRDHLRAPVGSTDENPLGINADKLGPWVNPNP